MRITISASGWRCSGILWSVLLFCVVLPVTAEPLPVVPAVQSQTYARIPDDLPLTAVKWTGGFWQERMQRLRNIYLPGVLDGSFMDLENGASYHNLLRAAGLEEGGAVARRWSDGDCYLVLDTVSRLYGYHPDDYLKTKLDYWIPIIARYQRDDGLVDTWSVLKDFDSKDGKPWAQYVRGERKGSLQGGLRYNMGHLHAAATTHWQVTGNNDFLSVADKAVKYFITHQPAGAGGMMETAVGHLYARTGEASYLNWLQQAYAEEQSTFGPPLRDSREIYGHNTYTSNLLMGATILSGFTGETVFGDALSRLAADLLMKKTYVTGAVAPVFQGKRPEMNVHGKIYPGENIHEAVGDAYVLPNDSAYCETCGQCLYMEWLYRMFRLTGEAAHMDAAERALYNTVPGCVDLDRANFFYCNPQEQLPGSMRSHSSKPGTTWVTNYTWKRLYTKQCACCPPKVMRAIAQSVEMAYSVNSEGLWVNLYGDNTAQMTLPGGAVLKCVQSSAYPWDGRIQLVFQQVENPGPFSVFLRIPGWVDGAVSIAVNGDVIHNGELRGAYYRIQRTWTSGDRVELELPMPVRFMAAHPNVADDRGKVAVMRGPVVYCLEDGDIKDGRALQNIFVPGNALLQPVLTDELSGVVKLTGQLVFSTTAQVSVNKLIADPAQTALYREARFTEPGKNPAGDDRLTTVTMIPYFTRLNRSSEYFKIWLPVY